ncbi:MAG: RNase adapter RapZ [Synergistaceae bacterium]|jgi:UPF0042 nucleotide-binding protein|nr:RNase adapter RapZ [Synergistaceae bacterium]
MADRRVERCVLISGLSGAGKTTALKTLEDQGFFAVDNVPPTMMSELMTVLSRSGSAVDVGVAIVADARGDALLDDLLSTLDELESVLPSVTLLFLDASDESLVMRFETTRRRHPLGDGVTIIDGITKERRLLASVISRADILIDTSFLLPSELRAMILSELGEAESPISVVVSSFGFKNGIPIDCDYLFDVRFLPNPNYVPELQMLSGKDQAIRDYLDRDDRKKTFVGRLESLVEFVLSGYENTSKKHVHIAVGCTGGRHRSVAIAEELASLLSASGRLVTVSHRDIDLEAG